MFLFSDIFRSGNFLVIETNNLFYTKEKKEKKKRKEKNRLKEKKKDNEKVKRLKHFSDLV